MDIQVHNRKMYEETNEEPVIEAYGTGGDRVDPKLQPDRVLAKRMVYKHRLSSCYIKMDNRLKVYDPENESNKVHRGSVANVWQLRAVSNNQFDAYLEFLKTGRQGLKSQAEQS